MAYLPMTEVDRAITAGAEQGFVKLLAGGRRLLGATIVAARGGEVIHESALATRTGMFTGRLAQTMQASRTWSLAVVQQAAAQSVGGYGGRTARAAGRSRS